MGWIVAVPLGIYATTKFIWWLSGRIVAERGY